MIDGEFYLAPCPFCGGKATVAMAFSSDGMHEHIDYAIICTACETGIFRPRRGDAWVAYASAEEAAAVWNRRRAPRSPQTPEANLRPMETRKE